jgi:hypothetical protein
VITVLVILGLMGVWLGIQALARRQARENCEDPDLIMCGGCGHNHAGGCGKRLADPDTE